MGYILNFQNNSNNMKNEIIRKITSLTLMTIMFAGGMTLAVPSFLPMEEILPAAYAENQFYHRRYANHVKYGDSRSTGYRTNNR